MTPITNPDPLLRLPAEMGLPLPRLRQPDRALLVPARPLDDLLPLDHRARQIWSLVCRWDLSRFLQTIRARGSTPGRAATAPKFLFALWL
jgi:hypothetical protein